MTAVPGPRLDRPHADPEPGLTGGLSEKQAFSAATDWPHAFQVTNIHPPKNEEGGKKRAKNTDALLL